MLGCEGLWLLSRRREREWDHGHLGRAERAQELDPSLDRADELHEVPLDDRAGMRMKCDHPHGEACRQRRLEYAPVPEVNPVERPDRDGGGSHDSRARARSAGMIRSSFASSTEKGPTSVRRRVVQWPPSASAIART